MIVQKYSAFVGLLPERRVSDLSPLVRRPCWHLKRDLASGMDGTVPLCRECVRGEIVVGNAFSEGGLREAWEAGELFTPPTSRPACDRVLPILSPVRSAMSTIPTTLSQRPIPYTVIGGPKVRGTVSGGVGRLARVCPSPL